MKGIRIEMNRDKNRLKRGKVIVLTATMLTAVTLLAGCSNERKENQLSYREVGIQSMHDGDYEGAIAAFDTALSYCLGSIGETEIDVCYYKAASQYAAGDTKGALATYDALIDYDNEDANAHYMRGCLLLQMGENQKAQADFSDAITHNEKDYELYINIYKNLAAYNLTAEGEEYLNKAFSIKGDSAQDRAYRGELYFLLGQYENALTELNAALKEGSVEANLTLAQVYEALGDAEMAETCYKAYVDSGVADSVALCALAEIEMEKLDYAAALSYIKQGLAMEEVTNRRQLMQNQIICMEYTGDFAGAWAVASEYIKLYPEDAEVQREYIFLKNRQGMSAAAQEVEAQIVPATETVETQSTEETAR